MQNEMKGSEVFFVLVAEYRMLINRIKVYNNQGMKKEHPDMQKLIKTQEALCIEIDKQIAKAMPVLNERHPNAAEIMYKKFNIQMV